jgi:thiol peroxidase
MIVHFKGSPLTLVGRQVKKGDAAPGFKATSQDLKDVTLPDFKDKVKVITSFPSLDTPVCDLQVKEFNKKASGLSGDVAIVGISKDLPFAQARFCHDNEIKNISVVSDYKDSSFGMNYGVLIKELNLLARSVIIIDKKDVVRYVQIVDELTTPPDYDDVIKSLKDVLKGEVPPKSGGINLTS